MINFIKDAISSVEGIADFRFYDDYKFSEEQGQLSYPCAVLQPIPSMTFNRNRQITDKMGIVLSIFEVTPKDYDGDTLYALQKKCADLMLQVLANLDVKTKFSDDVQVATILPEGDELLCGAMISLELTMRQPRCIGAPSYVEIVVQPIKKESITSNGKYIISADSGFTAMREVEVDVDIDLKGSLQDKQVTITENGTQTIVADEGYEGLNSVEVNSEVYEGFDLVSAGITQEFQNEFNANLLKDAIDYTITTMNSTSDSGSWSGKFANSRILFCTKSLKNITNLRSVFESTHIYAMVDLDIAKAGDIYHFFYQATCPYLPSYIDLSGLGSGNHASAFRDTKILKNEDTLTINVGWLEDNNNLLTLTYFFRSTPFNGEVSIEIIGNRLKDFSSSFWGAGGVKNFQCLNSNNITMLGDVLRDVLVESIIFGSLENCTSFNNLNTNSYLLKEFKFTHWKSNNILLREKLFLTASSIHYIIQNAMSVADGATARTLQLHATAKTNWENSEYYEQDLAVLTDKGITIA